MTFYGNYFHGLLCAIVCLVGFTCAASAEESESVENPSSVKHPLSWTFRYAKSRSAYIRTNIRDYSCRLIKRERIDGILQDHHFIEVKVRSEQQVDGEVVRPLAVFMQYLAPSRLKGRKILYVDGENDGMMIVRKGGRAFKYVKLEIDPNGVAARRESNHPITDVGFDKIIERLIQRVENDIAIDPEATNTEVEHFRDARINDRSCTHILVIHPEPDEGIEYHKASLYVDDDLGVPIRLTVHGWPEKPGDPPPLNEEYTYVGLKLNVGLSDSDFHSDQIESQPKDDRPAGDQTAANRTPR